MATNMKHCLLLLSMVLIVLIGLGLVSATDTGNTTQVVKDNNVLSTPSNYDVDNVVQSDLSNVKSDADVEKISDTSENTNTLTTNKQTAISNKTRNGNITKNNINDDIEKTIKGDGEGTFIELQELINVNSVINLDKNYKFTPGVDDREGSSLVNGIVIDHDITINGENYALDGSNLSRIFYFDESITVNINKVVFKNGMTTANGSAIYTLSTINVDNCTFANNTGNASGAVWISNFATNTQILNSTFINNIAKGYNTTSNGRTYFYGDGGALYFKGESINALIYNTTFINNSANANGGAILLNASYSNITSSRFYNNSAPYAAGAVRLDGKYLVVNDSLFDGNYDPIGNYSWGSAIYLTGNYTNITNSNFTNQYGSNTGGAVAIDGSNELLENITFINNTAYNGGAIFIQKNENVTFNNSNFINNTAIINGGAINIDAYANDTRILNSNFTNNKVTGVNNNGWLYGEGGAINFGQGCSNGIIKNSSFINNTALAKAGAVNWNGANGQIISSNFTNNSASLDGGAVLFTGNNGYINTSIFKNNTSNYAGGALRISGNSTTVNNTLFDGNYDPQKKAWGSAIYLSGHNAVIDYSNFTNNYGSVSAGAVYVAGANATISNSQFVNNNASSDAGAVLLNGTNGSIVNSNFTNSTAGHEGGAVYINGSFANITNSHFIQNKAKLNAGAIYIKGNNATIVGSNIADNIVTAGLGGAVYVSGNNATISYTNFSCNNASSDGGAIYIKGTKTTFEYCNMTYNWANGKGGVIYNNGVNASILYSNFEHNYAKNDGGSMDLTGSSNSIIIGCNFTNGTTNEHGGAISATNSNNLTIQSSRFVNCSNGNTHGGAIYLEGSSVDSNLLVDNCTFINDTSGKDAGAIYFQNQNGKNSTLSNCTFINCTTRIRSPGAVCWRENNGLIINNVFINCTAMSMDSTQYSGQGGAMYLENAVNNVLINDTFINCSAVWDGGAIYYRANSRNNTHINCTFINNTAGRNGGALYFLNANNTYDGCVFINNTAEKGGSIYYSVNDGIIMRNCIFENNSDVTEGGFIYVAGKNLNIDNTTFHNGLAQKGGALYVIQDVTIANSNITNNNATTGSAIYLKSGTVRLTNVNLLENQAHSKEFANTYNYVENGERVIGGQFTGYDNLLNGIYREAGNVICVNVKYLGVDGIVNTDDTQGIMTISINEIYQKVIIEVYDKDNSLFYEAINMTDKDGKYEFRFTDSEDYSYRLYHPEDEYYTYLVYALNKMIVNMTVTASNITYGESESIQIKISSDTDVVPTGRVTVYVNSTLEGFENRTYVRTLDDTGIIIIDDAPLNLLNASSYNVSVNYTGDINYFSEQANTTFNVSKKATIIDFDVEDYIYNQTRSIAVSLTDIDDTQLSGKLLLNITGALFNGTRVSINDIPLNIEVGPGGQTGNTYDLPILDAGNYEITAFYNETANYYQNTTVKRFTVNKANPTVNVTTKADEDEIFGIYVHVEPEISTNRVTITITNEIGIVDQFILTLDDSKAYKILDVLPVGHYDVSAYYLGDNNHYELTNTTSFDVTIENYPIYIQLRNMTYGQTQIIKVIVPKDGETDNLSIKLNGEDIAFTMDEEGIIQIDTQSLTDIVPDGKLVVGEYNLTVSYTTDGHYRSNSSSMLFNVTKADSTVNLQTSPISYGDNETVKVTINSYNATGNITVKLINSLDAVINSREFNINSNTPVEFNYTELEPGTYRVNVSYVNDTNYNDANVTSEFTVKTQQITINELSNIYVGENQRIWGIVTDGYGLAVTKGSVNITLSNGTNITCSLDSSGVYSSEPIFINNGTYIVSASYIYNDIIRTTSVERSFDVSKIPTITTVKILNNTVRHVSIDVIVQENVPGKYTGYVQNGVINVTIPGINDENTVGYPIEGINTTIPLNDITWVGTVSTTVVYNGSSKYDSSTGLNITDTSQIFDHIDVEAIASNVTIMVEPNPVISGSAVTITGRVYDESGLEITEGTVNIKVGDITYSNVEVGSNGYSHEYVTSIVGQIPVEVHFNGIKDGQNRDVVLESTNNTTFTVEVNKHKTNLTIVPFTGVEINKTFTITLNLTNRTGDAVVGKHINVLINKQPVTVTGVTGNDGVLTFDYVVHDSNLIIVEAKFVEDDEYLGNNTFWVYNSVISLLTANISVDVDHNPIFINDTLVISGSLNDSFTNETYPDEYTHPIRGAQVNININGTIITTTTDENGIYAVALTKDTYPQLLAYSSDNYVITAEYTGQAGVILGKAASTTYKVDKIYTNLTIDPISNVAVNQSFTVTINLTNRTGSPISDKNVYVQVNGIPVENLGKTNAQGQLTFEYTVHNNSEFIIEAVFEEDDIYYGNSTVLQYTDKIELLNSTISVNVNKSQIIVNETIKISGTLNSSFFNTTTGKYNPIAGVDVLIRINSADVKTVQTDDAGYYEYKLTTDEYEYLQSSQTPYNVTAIFAGISGVISGDTENNSYIVSKIATKTNITILNSTSGNVTLSINVTNESGSLIPSGHVIVTNATDGSILGEGNLTDGKVNITLNDVTKPGDIAFNVTFEGNDNYLPSNATGINPPEGMSNTTVITVTIDSNITINLDKDEVIIGETVRISGTVYNETGQPLCEDANVIVTIEGHDYEATFNPLDGTYYYDYTPEYNGTITVNASYIKDDQKEATSNSLNLTVNKIPTSVIITDITNVEVNKTFTIEVTLINENGTAITDKQISITVNGVELENVPLTDSTGKTSITFTPHNNTDLEIKAVYNGSEIYLASDDSTVVDVALSQSTLTVKVDKQAVYAGENVNISGKLIDGQSNKLVDQPVTIYVNGGRITTVLTDNDGEYSYVMTHQAEGEYTVQAVYDGVANAIIGDSDTTYYSVHKMPTNVTISLPDEVEVYVPFDIEVTLANNTANTNAISGKPITITVNGEVLTQVPLTGHDGKTVVRYNPQNNSTIVVRAVFEEDDYYLESSDIERIASENIKLSNSTITVKVNESSLYVDESVEIRGKLTDGLNRSIATADVKIYINDELFTTVETNRNGEYSCIINNLNKGNCSVRVVYEGLENSIAPSSNTTSYNVSKIPTITQISVINNTQSNVTIDVVITENVPGRHTNIVSAGSFEVTVNGKVQQYPVKGRNSTIVLDGNAFINTTDEVTFNVKYVENDKYFSSNGLNSSTGEEITTFNADSQQSSITVIATPETQTTGQTVTISGHVYDGMGNEITEGTVCISINAEEPVRVCLMTGGYSYPYGADIAGINNVTVVFEEVLTENSNVLIKSSTNNTTFVVDKIKTTTTVEILNNTVGNVTIDIKVVGADANNTITGDANIIIAGKNHTVSLIEGKSNLTVELSQITQAGDIQVSVEYLGNGYYAPSIANNTNDNKQLTNITVEKQDVNITLTTNVTSCYIGENVNISGNLTDGMGQRIADAIVTITVNGNKYLVQTNAAGEYSLVYKSDKLGEIPVNVTFAGDNYNDASANATFDVTKIPTTTSVDIINTTLSNVTVEVKVVDVYGEVVNGTVKVLNASDYTQVLTEAQVTDGVVNITIPSEEICSLEVIIEYQENDIYLSSNATGNIDPETNITVIDVTRIPTVTNVEIMNTTLSNVTIKVTVTNQTNNHVANGSVSILDENGNVIEDLTINLENGEATITLPFNEAKDYKVIVHYNENDVYMASNATNASIEGNPDENITIISVSKIPTKTNVTILDTTFNNVTIHVNVTNMTDVNVEDGTITIFDREGNVLVDNCPLTDGQADIRIPIEKTGELLVIVHYNENDAYMPINATNTSSLGALEEITFINVTKIPTITNVEIVSNLINNVTLSVNVTNTSTSQLVEKGQVAIYDTNGKELARSDLTDGKADIIIPRNVDGIFEVVVRYVENDIYYNSTAVNESAVAGRENITVINVTKITTKTNVEILNKTIGNVMVHISTTNMTDDNVTKGHVVVRDQNNNIIGEGELVNGGIDLTLNVTTPTLIGVNVSYNENDVYYSSNARNNTLPSPSPDENITYIDVAKQNATITINANKYVVVIGEDVTISGVVQDGMGIPITEGIVNVNINDIVYPVEIKDGLYTLTNITIAAGVYRVNATYTGCENISSITSEDVEFTVNKIPTTTTVKILNNTVGNVTIEVTVTNATGELVNTGSVVVKDADGTIVTGNLTDGKVVLVIPTENTDTLYVNVSYVENTQYYPSNATNKSSTKPGYENITVIDLVKQNATITIEVVNPSVIMGDNVTICGQVYDGMGNLITEGGVDVTVDGQVISTTIIDGYYTIKNQTYTAGIYEVSATYKGNTTVVNATSETASFTVSKMPTVTVVEVLNNTAGNVTIDVVVTNSTGESVTSGKFNVTVAGKTVTVDVKGSNTTVKLNITDDGDVAVKVSYLENDNYTSSDAIDKATIPESGSPLDGEVLDNITAVLQNATLTVVATPINAIVYQEVTINGTLIDGIGSPIANVYVEVTVNDTSIITKTNSEGIYSIVYTPLYNGTVNVKAVYAGNTTVDKVENTTLFAVDKIATITNVNIINTTLSNVTIKVNVTNSTGDVVIKGSIVVYDTSLNELAKANLTDGMVEVQVPTDTIGPLEVIVKYIENDLYLNSTALNDTAEPGRENITLIDVTRIPTQTSVEMLDNIAGNVTLAVNVTNMTGDAVTEGVVYVHNASNYEDILGTGNINDGIALIKLDTILESGLIEVVVEYQQNNVYMPSNATNSSAVDTPRENITVIDVQKQSVTITIELNNSSIIISESTVISGQVFDGMGEVVKAGNVTVYVTDEDSTTSEKTVEIVDEKYTLTYNGIKAGNYTVKAKYLGNASMTAVMSEELTFTVNKIPTETSVSIINTTLSNVTLGINVTNLTDAPVTKGTVTVKDTTGKVLNETTLNGGLANITIPADSIGQLRVIVTYNENNIYASSNATNSSAIGTPNEQIIIIDVTRIPTITSVEIVNTTLNNVTIDVKVTNMTGTPITTGNIVVTDTTGKILANGELSDSHIILSLPATGAGEIEVIVTYQENEVYLASKATNASAAGTARENSTIINVTKLPTITNVEILNTTLGNVTIGVNVMNMTESLVDRGYVIVYDKDDNILVRQTPLVNGITNITISATIGGQLEIRVEYQENDYYYASNATNSSADPAKQNITIINVTKMPTITTVDIINHTAGNVTVKVTVTNMTNDVVTEGKVHIKDNATGNIIAEATLTNGVSNITIPVSNTNTLHVIVEYQENDYYYASNATNNSATHGDENITVIDVVKQNATITIGINNNSIIIGDKVVISGVVKDELGNVITEGQVLVDIDGFQETVDIAESKYTLDYTPANIDNYTVKATYLGNDTVNPATSQTLNFTVGKMPTKTNVTIINTTVGNVTIGVNVTNLTDENVIKGNISVYDMNGNELVNNSLTDGLANITIHVEHDGQISVIVTYNENDLYLASNATNSSASGTPSEQIIVIDAVAQESNITIDTDKDTATIGENVTITGKVTDGMGNPITKGTVTIDVNGEKHTVNVTDGEYSLDYTIKKSGKLPVTATYNGEEGVIKASTSETVELTANKKETQVSATQVGNTPANTSIIINVTDDKGNPVNEGNVIVVLPDGTSVTAPVVGGKAVISINTTPGKTNVTVVYNGTGVYDKQSTNLTITTVKLNTTIPVDKINDVTIGDNITIHGSLSDQNGVDITNANITVTINGKKYNTTTNKAGEYTLTYTTTTSGINNITVEYAGNTIYNPTNNKTNFTVNKKDIVLDVKQTNNSAGNTSIEVKVTDDEGRPVNEGNVIVTLPNGTNVTVPVVNGTAVVPLNTTPGSIKVNITYNGTDKYNKQNCTSTVTTLKINTTIPINTIKTVSVGDKINITGKLLDSNNKTIANANITVKVNGKSYNTTTNNKGVYTLPYTTTTSGQNNVTVSYAGNKTYNPTNNQTSFTVKVNSTIKSKQTGSNVGNTTIQVNITDKNGNKVQNGTVTVKDKDGKVIGTAVVKNGTATVKLDVPEGKQNITVAFNGNELVNPSAMTQSISVNKNKAIITINTIKNITLTQKAHISGKLTDINGNPIANAKVVLNMDGVNKTVTTDRYGDYTLEYNTTHVGLNNVTAQFNGDNVYKSAKANSTYNASKIITYVTVADVKGVLGDNITLRATVTDEFGTKVTGGQFVFKVNGLTLRTNGKFEANGTPMILSPVNGTVTVTVVADTYLRSAVNITGAYGGNSKYYSSRSIVAGRASLVKRDAQITVTTVKTTKQDVKITLKAVVTDVTGGKNNGRVRDYEDNFVVFKVNGITIKNEDGTAKQAKVVNGVATMEYYVPAGLAGKYTNLTDKSYTVMAVFGSGSYNPGVQNTTTFGVERSAISFVNTTVTLNSQSKEMTVKSKIVDYHNNLLKGTNTLCLKINGQTYKINNKTVFFNAVDGDVDINMIVPYNVNKINSVELVTGERVGYLGGRYTTTDIIRV